MPLAICTIFDIHEAKPTPILNVLKTANMVRLRQIQLENRSTNITTELSRIFKTFEDFRLVQQIMEEIENLQKHIPSI
jgi:hypothetical protein